MFGLGQLMVEIGVAFGDRMVIAELAIALEQGFQDLLAVHGVFHRKAQVGIIVGGLVHCHGHHDMVAAGGAGNVKLAALDQRFDCLAIDAVDRVHLAGNQRRLPGIAVVDDGDLDAVKMAAAGLPVIAGALERHAHAGIKLFQRECASADRVGPVLEAGGNHMGMIVGEIVGEIGIRSVKRDFDRIGVNLLDILDRRHRALAAGLGIGPAMQVQRVEHVIGIKHLAVGEFDALAQLENPAGGTVLWLNHFGQFRHPFAILRPFNEAVEKGVAGGYHHAVIIAGDVD